MDKNGFLNFESKSRAAKAVEIFNEYEISYIVTCGWAYRSDSNIKIAEAFKTYLVDEMGVNPGKVITEVNSRDTVGDAFFTKVNHASRLNWRSVCVVTSNYHVARTNEIFNFIYGDDYSVEVVGTPIDYDESTLNHEIASMDAFKKTFTGVTMGSNAEILERLRERHPFYNGKVYSKI